MILMKLVELIAKLVHKIMKSTLHFCEFVLPMVYYDIVICRVRRIITLIVMTSSFVEGGN